MEFLTNIAKLVADGGRPVVSIDGPAGAGKTSLADVLARIFDCNVVHMDDLYEGWQQPLNSRLTDQLRLIITTHKAGGEICFPQFDWQKNRFAAEILLPAKPLLVVEGVGSGQAAVRDLVDLLIFIDIGPETGRARVEMRDGDEVATHLPEWQEIESAHFATNQTRAAADFLISGDASDSGELVD